MDIQLSKNGVMIWDEYNTQQIQICSISKNTFDAVYGHAVVYCIEFFIHSRSTHLQQWNSFPHSIEYILSEKEYNSPQLYNLIYNYAVSCTNLLLNLLVSENVERDSKTLRDCFQKLPIRETHTPMYGGWFTNARNFLEYKTPVNRNTRENIEKSPLYYSSLAHYEFSAIGKIQMCKFFSDNQIQIRSLLDSFKMVASPQKRLFLFLYFHYCLTASLFNVFQLKDILHITIDNVYIRSTVLEFIRQSPVCEYVNSSCTQKEIKSVYEFAKDIPFFVIESPAASNRPLTNKLNYLLAVREEILSGIPMPPYAPVCNNCTLCSGRFPFICNNFSRKPILAVPYAVPIILRDSPPRKFGDNMIHLFLGEDDLTHFHLPVGNMNPSFLYGYMNAFKQYIILELGTQNIIDIQKHENPIFFIFNTLYNALKKAYSEPVSSVDAAMIMDLNAEMEFNGDTTNFLNKFLPTLQVSSSFNSMDFINALNAARNEGTIRSYKRLDNSPVLTHEQLEKTPVVFIEEQHWLINKPAFDMICKSIPVHVSTPRILQTLSKDELLEQSNINNDSYQRRYSISISNSQSAIQYPFYALKIRTPLKEMIDAPDDCWHQKNEGYSLYLGDNIHNGKKIYADISIPQTNRHMMISGQSGSGKSYLLDKLTTQTAEQNITTVIRGCGQKLGPNQESKEKNSEKIHTRRTQKSGRVINQI